MPLFLAHAARLARCPSILSDQPPLPMYADTAQNPHAHVRVVSGSTFDGAPYQIILEDSAVSTGSSARIRRGRILGSEPLVVAVKVFGELLDDVKQELLVRELRFAREVSLCHNLILAFLGTATVGEQTAIVSLYMKNGNLMEYIKNRPECDKKALILQVAEAVEFLHVAAQLVHGDLKCENVLISDFGEALLADFGLSSFVEKSETLSTTMTAIRSMNTVHFAAPELLLGDGDVTVSKTRESDVYAFGMLVLEAISEQPPWGKKNKMSVIQSVGSRQHPPRPTSYGAFVTMSHSWWDTCQRCWRFEPASRPSISAALHSLRMASHLTSRKFTFKTRPTSLAYTPDGETFAAGFLGGSVLLVDPVMGGSRCLRRDMSLPLTEVRVAVSPDGQRIAVGDGKVSVLDASSGAIISSMQHRDVVTCIAYSPDGTRIVSGDDRTVNLWDASTGAVTGHLQGPLFGFTGVTFSPDSTCIAASSGDGTIRIWDNRARVLITLEHPGKCMHSYSSFMSACFSPDGMRLASGTFAGQVMVWELHSRYPALILDGHRNCVDHVVFSPSGNSIVSASRDGTIRVWDARSGSMIGAPLTTDLGRLHSIALSPDGRTLASAWDGNTIHVWDLFP